MLLDSFTSLFLMKHEMVGGFFCLFVFVFSEVAHLESCTMNISVVTVNHWGPSQASRLATSVPICPSMCAPMIMVVV
jgi:hypothetical protein